MRLLLCLLVLLPFLEAFVLPRITFNSNVQVDDVCAEGQSRSPQQLVQDALDYRSSATGCKKVCPMADHISNKRKDMRRIWKRAQVDGWLEVWLKAVPYKDWPYRVAKQIWDKPSPDIQCGSMEGNCHPLNNNCYSLCKNGGKQAPGYLFYWAAERFHTTTKTMHEFFQNTAIHDALGLDGIVSDWDGASDTDSQTDVASILGASLGVAGTVVGATPGGAAAGAALGTLSGIFSIAEAASGGGGGGGSPSKTLQHLVQRFFGHSEHLLKRTLHDVFGYGHPDRIPVHGASIGEERNIENDDDNKSHWHTAKVSKFFEHGRWLFRDTDAHVGKFESETRKALKQALGVFAMNNKFKNDPEGKGYAVMINTDVAKEDCGQQDKMARWTRGHCFNLFYFYQYSDTTGTWRGYWDVGDDWVHTFKKYDLRLKKYYNNVWDCATSHAMCHHGNHTVKWHDWKGKGTPLCLFHTNLVLGSYDASTGKMSDVKNPCHHKHSADYEHDPADDNEEGFLDTSDQRHLDHDEQAGGNSDVEAFMRTARQGFLNHDKAGPLNLDKHYGDDDKEDWWLEL